MFSSVLRRTPKIASVVFSHRTSMSFVRLYHHSPISLHGDKTDVSKSSSSETPSKQRGNVLTGFNQLMSYFGFKVAPLTYSTSKTLLDNCIVASKNRIWYSDKRGKIGLDFRSQHTLLLLHIWMIHKRMLKEGERGKDIQVEWCFISSLVFHRYQQFPFS